MTMQRTPSTDNMANDDGHHECCAVPSSPAETPRSTKKKSYLRTKQNTDEQQRRRHSKSAIQASLDSFLAEDKIWDKPSSWLMLDFDDESSVESFLTPIESVRKRRSSSTSRGVEGWGEMQLKIDGSSPASTLNASNGDSSTTHSRSKGKIKQRSNSCTSLPKTKRKETTPSGWTPMTPQSSTVNKRGLGRMDSWAVLQVDDVHLTTLRPSSSLSSVPSSSRRAPPRASSMGALPKGMKKQMSRLKANALSAPKAVPERPTSRRNSSAILAG